jgi:tetratricopeptide (TPR) repeat protein
MDSAATALTEDCHVDPDITMSMKLAFESRAAQSVQIFERYVQRLETTIKGLRTFDSETKRVCRLYALDELAEIYTRKLVKFDEAKRTNSEAETLLEKITCCPDSNLWDRKEAQLRQERSAQEFETQVEARRRDLQQSQERLRALTSELNLADQRERKRLTTELHDHMQKMLVTIEQGKQSASGVPAYAAGPYFPITRQIYSYLFTFKGYVWKSSLYPPAYLNEVSKRDLEEVSRRIQARKALLERVFDPSFTPAALKTTTDTGTATKMEVNIWRQAIEGPEIAEETKALLLADRTWNLRQRFDEPTWLSLVRETQEAVMKSEAAGLQTGSTASIITHYRLGYALLRQGQLVEGIRLLEEMLTMVVAYQKHLEAEYDRVQRALAWEQGKAKVKGAMAKSLSVAATGLSYALPVAAHVVTMAPSVGGLAGPLVKELTPTSYLTSVQNWAVDVVGGSVSGGIFQSVASGLDAVHRGNLEAMQYARFKSLETVRLFGETPPGLPLFLNERERLYFHIESGAAYDKLERYQEAIDQYKNAVEIIESERAGLGQEKTRLTFLRDKLRVYERLILLLVKMKMLPKHSSMPSVHALETSSIYWLPRTHALRLRSNQRSMSDASSTKWKWNLWFSKAA